MQYNTMQYSSYDSHYCYYSDFLKSDLVKTVSLPNVLERRVFSVDLSLYLRVCEPYIYIRALFVAASMSETGCCYATTSGTLTMSSLQSTLRCILCTQTVWRTWELPCRWQTPDGNLGCSLRSLVKNSAKPERLVPDWLAGWITSWLTVIMLLSVAKSKCIQLSLSNHDDIRYYIWPIILLLLG